MFRVVSPLIIRSTSQYLALVKPSLLPSAIVEKSEFPIGSSSFSTIAEGSQAHITVITASGTGQIVSATFQLEVPTSPRKRKIAETVCPVPDAAITVVCAPDDGWSYHPKHVEQFTEI
jgi:hypothetical protein